MPGSNSSGGDVDGPLDDDGSTALMVAAGCGHAALVQALLAAGANVNAERHGRTALIVAAGRLDAGVVRVLLEAGAGVKATEALHEAVETCIDSKFSEPRLEYPNRSTVVSMLVAAGADVNQEPMFDNPVFVFACCAGDPDIVRPMLQYSNDEWLIEGFTLAVYRRFSSLATLLLNEIASRGLAAIVKAAYMQSWLSSSVGSWRDFLPEQVINAWLAATADTDAQLAAVAQQQQELAAVASSVPHVVIPLEAQGRAGWPTTTSQLRPAETGCPEADEDLAGDATDLNTHWEQQW